MYKYIIISAICDQSNISSRAMLASNVSTGGIFFANKMRTQGYVTMLDPLQVCGLF